MAGSGAFVAARTMAEPHVILLGDSVFDNAAYVGGGPDVRAQVQARLPAGARCTLGAVDGSTTSDVAGQLARVPGDATHLVISVGGNDALRQEGILQQPARSVGEALGQVRRVAIAFRTGYSALLDLAGRRRLPLAVCTIYDPQFPDPVRQALGVAGLTLFNDAVLREAFARGLTVIDLRLVCSEVGDLANSIEPSVNGGAKIASCIALFASGRGGPTVLTGRER